MGRFFKGTSTSGGDVVVERQMFNVVLQSLIALAGQATLNLLLLNCLVVDASYQDVVLDCGCVGCLLFDCKIL